MSLIHTLVNAGPVDALDPSLFSKLEAFRTHLCDQLKADPHPLFEYPYAHDDLEELESLAASYRARFDRVIIIGTGGSSLGAKMLNAAVLPKSKPLLYFLENVDTHTFSDLMYGQDLDRTGFIVISKSGSTTETLSLVSACLSYYKDSTHRDHFIFITEPGNNLLRGLAQDYYCTVLDHDPALGGRYSVLSLVGLLPALIVGLDPARIRKGAAGVLDQLFQDVSVEHLAPAQGAAFHYTLAEQSSIRNSVMMVYSDPLFEFASWYRQLWAESLGKQGAGTTPIRAVGTVDQHSQLQLYIDGPADKSYTFVEIGRHGTDVTMPQTQIPYLHRKRLHDIMKAECQATIDVLIKAGRPVRRITIPTLDEEALGSLIMHFILETLMAAHLWDVNPYDQPAVEEIKVLTKKYLMEPS